MDRPASEISDRDTAEAAAEEVRAYLVALRGGAPFLSGQDGRLLVRWLDQGIAVGAILSALDQVAEKRRQAKTRGRLSLNAARRLIEKEAAGPKRSPMPTGVDLSVYIEELGALELTPDLAPAMGGLINELRSIPTGDPEPVAQAAIAACRGFHEACWHALSPEHGQLFSEAELQLSALKSRLSEAAFVEAVEEVARGLVRRRTPLVSAKVVWDRVTGHEHT